MPPTESYFPLEQEVSVEGLSDEQQVIQIYKNLVAQVSRDDLQVWSRSDKVVVLEL